MNKIVGRNHEISLLKQALNSDKSELLAIYGRRRVGKTFLIREFFKSEIIFEVSGLHNGTMKDQLNNFSREISKKAKKTENKNASDWFDAFALLENYLDKQKSTKKKVIFIDEFPWIATAKSKFLTAFENFWNCYCTQRSDLIVVICGSAASYMI